MPSEKPHARHQAYHDFLKYRGILNRQGLKLNRGAIRSNAWQLSNRRPPEISEFLRRSPGPDLSRVHRIRLGGL